jgi:hypothetical protein
MSDPPRRPSTASFERVTAAREIEHWLRSRASVYRFDLDDDAIRALSTLTVDQVRALSLLNETQLRTVLEHSAAITRRHSAP